MTKVEKEIQASAHLARIYYEIAAKTNAQEAYRIFLVSSQTLCKDLFALAAKKIGEDQVRALMTAAVDRHVAGPQVFWP